VKSESEVAPLGLGRLPAVLDYEEGREIGQALLRCFWR